jgi:hypothetical protein
MPFRVLAAIYAPAQSPQHRAGGGPPTNKPGLIILAMQIFSKQP